MNSFFIEFQKTWAKDLSEGVNNANSECYKWLLNFLYPHGVICPHCGKKHPYNLKNGKYKCSGCGAVFSIYKNTIFEYTKLPLYKWFRGVEEFMGCTNDISSYDFAAKLGITQKTAWYILQKLRILCKEESKMGNCFICANDGHELVYNKQFDKYVCPKCGNMYVIYKGVAFIDNNFNNTQSKYNEIYNNLRYLDGDTKHKKEKTNDVLTQSKSAEYRDVYSNLQKIQTAYENGKYTSNNNPSYIIIDTAWLGGRMYWKHLDEQEKQRMEYIKKKAKIDRIKKINRYNKSHDSCMDEIEMDDERFIYMTMNKVAVCAMYDVKNDKVKLIAVNGDTNKTSYNIFTNFTNGNVSVISDNGINYDVFDYLCDEHLINCHKQRIYTVIDKHGVKRSSNLIETINHHLVKQKNRTYCHLSKKHIQNYLNSFAWKYNNQIRNNGIRNVNNSIKDLMNNINTVIRYNDIKNNTTPLFA